MRLPPNRLLEAPFALAVLLGAGLTFWIEPLFAKMLLPAFGGAPSVWTTALMFFQAALLAGYLYAHLLTRLAAPRRQVLVHLAVLAAAAATFPPALHDQAPDAAQPVWAVLQALARGVGLPLVALTATAPLLQRWFAGTGHRNAADPYFLYAASNLGSLVALLGFPLVLEPTLGLGGQLGVWMSGYAVLALLVLFCGRLPEKQWAAATRPTRPAPARWPWVALAAVPSSLLSGVTTAVATDVASGPLLWAAPLSLYLLTFILAFARRRLLPLRLLLLLQPIVLVPVIVPGVFLELGGAMLMLALHLVAFFVSALVCHSTLADLRPESGRLTEYYLLLALGGLIGGAFNALVAPVVFADVLEYPLALVLALALRPREGGPAMAWTDVAAPAALAGLAALAVLLVPGDRAVVVGAASFVLALAALPMATRPLRLAVAVAAAFAFPMLATSDRPLFNDRNFFGVLRISEKNGVRVLTHGTTVHGVQVTGADGELTPRAYYHPLGPAGQAVQALPAARRGDVAVLGLGAGSFACYLGDARSVAFYDIDPMVMRVAADPALFTFVAKCRTDARMVLGDARLKLMDSRQRHSLLVLDVFSSDAIPVHLLTREAFALYLERLDPDGVLLANISNRYLDLAPQVAALASELKLSGRMRCDGDRSKEGWKFPSCWVALARDAAPLAGIEGWRPLPDDPGVRVWTDDFSDTLSPMLRRLFPAS